jgi:hypothetical protein
MSFFLPLFVFLLIWILSFHKEAFTVEDTVKHYKSDPFEKEIFHPGCCPSTYSSSQGCLCECKTIVNLLASRGGNRMMDPL